MDRPVTLTEFFRNLHGDIQLQSQLRAKLVAGDSAYEESLPNSETMERLGENLKHLADVLETMSTAQGQKFTQKEAADKALRALKERWFIIEEYKEVSSAIFNACAERVTSAELKESNIESGKARVIIADNVTKAMDKILEPLLEGINSPTVFTRH